MWPVVFDPVVKSHIDDDAANMKIRFLTVLKFSLRCSYAVILDCLHFPQCLAAEKALPPCAKGAT